MEAMKKRAITLCFAIGYVVVPAMAVFLQAYLSDRVVVASHYIEQHYPIATPATYHTGRKSKEKPVSL